MYAEKKSGRGCLFWGGIIAAVLFLFLLLAVYGTYRYVKGMIAEWTDTKPLPAPTVQLSHSEITNLQQRVHAWDDGLKHNQAVGSLTLTADEINALIAADAPTNGPADSSSGRTGRPHSGQGAASPSAENSCAWNSWAGATAC